VLFDTADTCSHSLKTRKVKAKEALNPTSDAAAIATLRRVRKYLREEDPPSEHLDSDDDDITIIKENIKSTTEPCKVSVVDDATYETMDWRERLAHGTTVDHELGVINRTLPIVLQSMENAAQVISSARHVLL